MITPPGAPPGPGGGSLVDLCAWSMSSDRPWPTGENHGPHDSDLTMAAKLP
jgi:hypothetical protein